jgi:hypothetical protein
MLNRLPGFNMRRGPFCALASCSYVLDCCRVDHHGVGAVDRIAVQLTAMQLYATANVSGRLFANLGSVMEWVKLDWLGVSADCSGYYAS